MFVIKPILKITFGNTVEVILIRKKDMIQSLMKNRAMITSKQKIKQGIEIPPISDFSYSYRYILETSLHITISKSF